MRYIADLEIHSRYSRACSKNITLQAIADVSRLKGLDLVSMADCTHPRWLAECKEQLRESSPGFYRLSDESSPLFVVGGEVSLVFTQKGRARRIHLLLYLPNIEAAERFNAELAYHGKIESDGRPILSLHAKTFLRMVLEKGGIVIPAHAWTPWFGIFGSMSGFDSLEECFEEMTPYIPAIETGLSSDISMNARISFLDSLRFVSFSDAHSAAPHRLGREATIFELEEPTFDALKKALRIAEGISATIEFFPEEGMYHFDGHRNCGIRFSPAESRKSEDICPVCQRPVTKGVLRRTNDLAARPAVEEQRMLPNGQPYWIAGGRTFFRIVPLAEILAEGMATQPTAKKVLEEYERIVAAAGSELKIFLEMGSGDIARISPLLADGVQRLRSGTIEISPGYDGTYGTVKVFGLERKQELF